MVKKTPFKIYKLWLARRERWEPVSSLISRRLKFSVCMLCFKSVRVCPSEQKWRWSSTWNSVFCGKILSLGKPKVNKVKIFLPFSKLMKCPQTKFHAHTMRESQVLRSKKRQNSSLGQNLSLGQTFLAAQFVYLYWYSIETTTTGIDTRYAFASFVAILK